MATLDAASQLTLVELAKRTNDGKILEIAETLNETNDILNDAVWVKANQETSHKCTRRLTLPSGTWRKLNEGIDAEASQTLQVVEGIGMLEAYSKVDTALVDIAPDPKGFRFSEDKAFLEGLSQSLADALVYGNADTDPEQFNGLAPRYNAVATNSVISAGGSGSSTTSIWIVQWGENKVHLIYPKNSRTIGIDMNDLGECTVLDANNKEFQAYRTHFRLNVGLAVRDPRCIKRIANIETSGTSNIFDEDHLITLLNELPYNGTGAVVYCNSTIRTQMDIAAKNETNVNYTSHEIWGKPVMHFRGVPVRKVEGILSTETAIS
jgi:hypothetical protein